MATATVQDEDLSFTSIAEAFVQSLRDGDPPSVSTLAARYPHWAKEIEQEFPSLIIAEQLNLNPGFSRRNVPQSIGQYRIKGEIGQGGMGKVYSAVDEKSEREVALKVMSLIGAKRKNGLKRFRREANSARLLNHPNIVPILDHIENDSINCIVMPKIDGLDLATVTDRVRKAPSDESLSSPTIPFESVASVGLQVASALAYAHGKGLVHRDIKPGNLLLEKNGHIWVMDFGLVKTQEIDKSLSRTGDLIGTPRYMAPEQLRGVCDSRSDIYGLGITLYELITGKKAWGRLRGQALLTRPSGLELVPIQEIIPSVPPTLAAIITKCCALDPEDRYQTADELKLVLDRFLQDPQDGDRRKTLNTKRSFVNRKAFKILAVIAALGVTFILAVMSRT